MTAQGYRPNQMYEIVAPNGRRHTPPEGRCWSMIRPEFEKLVEAKRIYWGKDGNAQPSVIRFLSEVEGLVPWTWWPHGEVGHTDESKKEANALFGADVSFGTPKPERLLQRILHIATNPGDLVLDSFLGSGTTAAVAHKMGRRWIGIEMGDHAEECRGPLPFIRLDVLVEVDMRSVRRVGRDVTEERLLPRSHGVHPPDRLREEDVGAAAGRLLEPSMPSKTSPKSRHYTHAGQS